MTKVSKRPPIHMIDEEANVLADLAMSNQSRHPVTTALLLDEIVRAQVHRADKIAPDVVTMGAIVESSTRRAAPREPSSWSIRAKPIPKRVASRS